MTGCGCRARWSPKMPIELIAPAKVNLALEVTGRRPDGYHEVVSVAQTIALAARVVLDLATPIGLPRARSCWACRWRVRAPPPTAPPSPSPPRRAARTSARASGWRSRFQPGWASAAAAATGPPSSAGPTPPAGGAEDKTRRMSAALTPADFSDGRRARILAESLRRGLPVVETDLVNAFDRHLAEVAPPLARARAGCREAGLAVHPCGSGPGF